MFGLLELCLVCWLYSLPSYAAFAENEGLLVVTVSGALLVLLEAPASSAIPHLRVCWYQLNTDRLDKDHKTHFDGRGESRSLPPSTLACALHVAQRGVEATIECTDHFL